MCGSTVAPLGARQDPWESTISLLKAPGNHPKSLEANQGSWEPTKQGSSHLSGCVLINILDDFEGLGDELNGT